MPNKYIPYTKEVNVKIEEKKAPTDESVRLLNEMMEKAQKNIIGSIKIDDNLLNIIGACFSTPPPLDKVLFQIRFKLNGKEYFIEEYIDKEEIRKVQLKATFDTEKQAVLEAVYKRICEIITLELIKQSPSFFQAIFKVLQQ